jgi:nucleoside-diphosphate-sugar epimerase
VGARLVSFENLYVYGQPGPVPFAEDAPHRPRSEKGRVRVSMIDELQRLVARGELEVDHVRASDLFGPGMRESALGDEVMGRVAAGKDPRVLGNPELPHTWTFTDDAGETLARVGLGGGPSGRVWHVPSAPPVSQREVVETLQRLVGRQLRLLPTPGLVLRLVGLVRPAAGALVEMLYEFEQPFAMADAATRAALGQTHTPLETALERTLAAFAGHRTDKGRREDPASHPSL